MKNKLNLNYSLCAPLNRARFSLVVIGKFFLTRHISSFRINILVNKPVLRMNCKAGQFCRLLYSRKMNQGVGVSDRVDVRFE